jgi:hypothetical protein
MKDEQIYSYAFGELSDSELQRIEAELMKDSLAHKEAELLSNLRSDLKSLQEIPEMQLSTERLREAILGQGLKPIKPSFAWWTWLGGPLAAASVFLLFFASSGGMNRLLGRSPEPQIVLGELSKKSEPMLATTSPGSEKVDGMTQLSNSNKAFVLNNQSDSTKGVSESNTASRKIRRKSKSSRKAYSGMTLVATNVKATSASANIVVAPEAPKLQPVDSNALSDTEVTFDGGNSSTPDSTIVMINTEKDESTGAPIATEVRNPSNVVIGG